MKPFAKDPFSLMAFHRVLIGVAVASCIFYGAWEIYRNYSHEPAGALVRALIAWALAAALFIYLLRIRGRK
jgi:hypothetical protein